MGALLEYPEMLPWQKKRNAPTLTFIADKFLSIRLFSIVLLACFFTFSQIEGFL